MKIIFLYIFFCLSCSSFLFGKFDDSTRTYKLNDVVVTGTRNNILSEKLPSSVSVISTSTIETNVGTSVASALNGISGMYLKSYGGIGALQTISLRGMSAVHTLIVVDGIRASSFQNGLSDVGILSSSNVERIEILKGGNSAMYGADAIGGVVNIISKKPTENFEGTISSSIGSFGYKAIEVGLSKKINSELSFRTNVRKENSDGNYKFYFDDGKTKTLLQRNGGDFSMLFVNARIDWKMQENFSSFVSLNVGNAKRGVPNTVTNAFDVSKTRLNDNNIRSHFGFEWKYNELFSSKLNSTFQYGEETYDNPFLVFNEIAAHDMYFNRSVIVEPRLHFNSSENFFGTFGSEFSRSWIQSNQVKNVVRYQQSVFLSMENSLSTFSNSNIELTFFPSIRYDNFSDVGDAVSSKIGVNIGFLSLSRIRFRSSYGSSFHVPTFNDLYWINGGNPNLKPEHSTSFDCGIISSFDFFGKLSFEANYFFIDTRERILWKPNANGIWSPINIGKVKSEGIELETTLKTLEEKLSLTANTALNSVKKMNRDFPNDETYGKQLVYLPQQTINISTAFSESGVTFSMQHSWVSFRYTTEMNDRFLPHYNVTSASVLYQFSFENTQPFFKAEVTNLFNESYQVLPSYPMPLKEIRFTIGVEKK